MRSDIRHIVRSILSEARGWWDEDDVPEPIFLTVGDTIEASWNWNGRMSVKQLKIISGRFSSTHTFNKIIDPSRTTSLKLLETWEIHPDGFTSGHLIHPDPELLTDAAPGPYFLYLTDKNGSRTLQFPDVSIEKVITEGRGWWENDYDEKELNDLCDEYVDTQIDVKQKNDIDADDLALDTAWVRHDNIRDKLASFIHDNSVSVDDIAKSLDGSLAERGSEVIQDVRSEAAYLQRWFGPRYDIVPN